MHNHIPKGSSLLIISDTAMWQVDKQTWVFEPTLREVEWLADMFKQVTWIGYGQPGIPKSFARASEKINIDFVLLPYAVGGNSFIQKLKILPFVPKLIFVILKNIRRHTYVHTRGPSVPALIAIIISYVDRVRVYWHKYAGNWIQNPTPKAYEFQRFLLRYNPHKVSINGSWKSNPSNFLNLENPCLTNAELQDANNFANRKPVSHHLSLCFVGAIIPAKGTRQFIEALSLIKDKSKIKEVFIVGDGTEREELELMANQIDITIHFLGYLKRDAINDVYKKSDIIVLPSAAEGFPKVLAEASAFGCIPMVTRISSIDQYIKQGEQGLLLQDNRSLTIARVLDSILEGKFDLPTMKKKALELSSLFTYERYCFRVQNEILVSKR